MKTIQEIFRSYGKVDEHGNHVDGTDKATNHNYGDVYDKLFPDRESVKLMLELGVSRGGSLLAWCEIFPNAKVVGMDIDDNCTAKHERIEHHVGNIHNYIDCIRVTKARLFDLIVDDASHDLDDTLFGLKYLWPFVTPSGLYVIEDIGQGPRHRESIQTILQYFIREWPAAEIYPTTGPRGGPEPLVVLRK